MWQEEGRKRREGTDSLSCIRSHTAVDRIAISRQQEEGARHRIQLAVENTEGSAMIDNNDTMTSQLQNTSGMH